MHLQPGGADAFLGAVMRKKHDGSILDNLGSLFQGGVDANVVKDGEEILGYIETVARSQNS